MVWHQTSSFQYITCSKGSKLGDYPSIKQFTRFHISQIIKMNSICHN
uniref:Uncharacterized protein n=1 Tax=Rhizophora mucronata TaxID=61149 RepID=A0A2P2R0H2_RHIMU